MPNFLTTVEKVKNQFIYSGTSRNQRVFDAIDFVSRDIEGATDRLFIPRIETRKYDWPQDNRAPSWELELDADLLELLSVTTQNNNLVPVQIDLADIYLGPLNSSGYYSTVHINLSHDARFTAGSSFQRAIHVQGRWAYSDSRKPAGILAVALGLNDTQVVCSDASKIDVGHTLIVDDEYLFVTERYFLSTTATLADGVVDRKSGNAVNVSNGSLIHQGEIILVDAEKMLVESVAGNVLGVVRAYDGTTLDDHDPWAPIFAARLLDVEREVNGTDAATHLINAPLKVFEPHGGAAGLALAESIVYLLNNEAGWIRKMGGGDSETQAYLSDFEKMRKRVIESYQRNLYGAVAF